MTVKGLISAFTQQEDLNFLLTNRIPRPPSPVSWAGSARSKTRLCGICRSPAGGCFPISICRKPAKPNSRACTIASPANFARACGPPIPIPRSWPAPPTDHRRVRAIADTELFQIKGAPYSLLDLLGDPAGGAPPQRPLPDAAADLQHVSPLSRALRRRIERVTFIHGDVWNVNPIALKRVERLFCKNERAVLETRLRPARR
jgi:Phosphatidylserine decarboxylase.